MKKYKLETSIFWSKVSKDKNHILNDSELEIQGLLDRYGEDGWTLESANVVSFGSAMYFYHYFSRDVEDSDK